MPKYHEGLKGVSIWLAEGRVLTLDEHGLPDCAPDIVFNEEDMIGVTLGETGSVQVLQRGDGPHEIVVLFYPGHMNAFVRLDDTEHKLALATH